MGFLAVGVTPVARGGGCRRRRDGLAPPGWPSQLYGTGRSQPPYPSTEDLLTPAELLAFGDTDALDTFDLLVGHQRHAGVVEIQARRNLPASRRSS